MDTNRGHLPGGHGDRSAMQTYNRNSICGLYTMSIIMPPLKKEGILRCTCLTVRPSVGLSVGRYVGLP